MPRSAPASAVLLFATAAIAATPSTRPLLLSRSLREVMLRQVDQSTPDKSDRAHAEWYTPDAEALLQRLLASLPETPADQRKSRGSPVEGWDNFDTEALFLLCRAQMGCLEAALKELDRASRMVAHVREKWQLISGGTASQVFNENVMRAARATRRLALLTARGLSMRKAMPATNRSLDGISGDGVSGEITDASAAAELAAAAAAAASGAAAGIGDRCSRSSCCWAGHGTMLLAVMTACARPVAAGGRACTVQPIAHSRCCIVAVLRLAALPALLSVPVTGLPGSLQAVILWRLLRRGDVAGPLATAPCVWVASACELLRTL